MTPKEKAIELVNNFKGLAHSDFHNQTGYDESQREENAKQCALIAVNEILNNDGFTNFDEYLTQYWQEVKKEIELL